MRPVLLTVRVKRCTATVKLLALVAVPPGVVTLSGPVVAPLGTVAEIEVEEVAVKLALVPLNRTDRKSTRLNSSHGYISYAVFCLKKKKKSTSKNTETEGPRHGRMKGGQHGDQLAIRTGSVAGAVTAVGLFTRVSPDSTRCPTARL